MAAEAVATFTAYHSAAAAVQQCINVATALYDDNKDSREGREKFGRYMGYVGHILHGVKNALPERAAPVARALIAQLERAKEKIAKYQGRNRLEGVLFARHEAKKLSEISGNVHELLTLLTACCASTVATSTASTQLLDHACKLQASSSQASAHLNYISVALKRMADNSATAADVESALQQLQNSMLTLGSHAEQQREVQRAVNEVQCSLSSQVQAVDNVAEEFRFSMNDILTCLNKLEEEPERLLKELETLRALIEKEGSLTREALQKDVDTILEVISGLSLQVSSPEEVTSPAEIQKRMYEAVMNEVKAGKVQLRCCYVKERPFTTDGDFVPVLAPCGCTMSLVAYKEASKAKKCQLCNKPVPAQHGNGEFQVNMTVLRVVQAERQGCTVPVIERTSVSCGEFLGKGIEGSVYRGTLGNDQTVALKVMELPPGIQVKDAASLQDVIATSYIVGHYNRHVCRLYGASWTKQEVWMVMEYCEGTLSDLLERVRIETSNRGLPVMDVVVLGISIADALRGVHEIACAWHLDVKPDNVLLRKGDTGGKHTAVLGDFGLMQKLNRRVKDSLPTLTHLSEVALGTPGYASPEQGEDQKATSKSDVYSLGATLLFAASYEHPYGGGTHYQVARKIVKGTLAGEAMAVPPKNCTLPKTLEKLLKSMVDLDPTKRPTLRQVFRELLRLHSELSSQGYSAEYLRTVWDDLPTASLVPSDENDAPSSASVGAVHTATQEDTSGHGTAGRTSQALSASPSVSLRSASGDRAGSLERRSRSLLAEPAATAAHAEPSASTHASTAPYSNFELASGFWFPNPEAALQFLQQESFTLVPADVTAENLFTHLQELRSKFGHNLSYQKLKALVPHLSNFTSLKKLWLHGNHIGPKGVFTLGPHIAKLTMLVELYLYGNRIGSNGARLLAPHLAELSSLQALNLDGNEIGKDGAKSLAMYLTSLTSLHTLYLQNNEFGSQGAWDLAPCFAKLKSLQILHIYNNGIGDEGATALWPHLANLSNLEELNLKDNKIGEPVKRFLENKLSGPGPSHVSNLIL